VGLQFGKSFGKPMLEKLIIWKLAADICLLKIFAGKSSFTAGRLCEIRRLKKC